MEKTRKDALLLQWEAAASALAKAKETEMNLRSQVVEAFYPAHKDEGTENVELGNGFKLKAVFKMSRRLAAIDAVNDALNKIEATGPEGKFIAERIVRWKPELDKKEYDQLGPQCKSIIDTVLTISPATPALEIVEPKAKK
jgi:hypothetical protein